MAGVAIPVARVFPAAPGIFNNFSDPLIFNGVEGFVSVYGELVLVCSTFTPSSG